MVALRPSPLSLPYWHSAEWDPPQLPLHRQRLLLGALNYATVHTQPSLHHPMVMVGIAVATACRAVSLQGSPVTLALPCQWGLTCVIGWA
jgi:hypothetical protein